MSLQDTLSRLERALATVSRDIPLGEARSRTLDEMGLDSVAVLSFLVAIEDEFGIELSDDTPASALRSVSSLAQFIEQAHGRAAS